MKKNKNHNSNGFIIFVFLGVAALIGFGCFLLLRNAENWQIEKYNNLVNLPDLVLTFIGFAAATFFSIATYLNLNLSKEKRIIDNYALINFCDDISIIKEIDSKESSDNQKQTELCFLVTKSINSPIYKVTFKTVKFDDVHSYDFLNINAKYSENTLGRNYNCLSLFIPLDIVETKKLFKEYGIIKVELSIESIFHVLSIVKYEITVGKEKQINNEDEDKTNDNPDKTEFNDLTTWQIHHSIYSLEKQYKL